MDIFDWFWWPKKHTKKFYYFIIIKEKSFDFRVRICLHIIFFMKLWIKRILKILKRQTYLSIDRFCDFLKIIAQNIQNWISENLAKDPKFTRDLLLLPKISNPLKVKFYLKFYCIFSSVLFLLHFYVTIFPNQLKIKKKNWF